MTGRQPFSMIPHGDFLARASDLEGDEIALFTVAFFLMLERRGPIPDDMAWLGRRAGISTRRANQIRAKLIDQGKWQARGEQLGDPAALGIIDHANRRSAINRSNALERWNASTQPELDFETKAPKKRRKSATSADATASAAPEPEPEMQTGGKSGEKPEINQRTNRFKDDLIPQETAENRQSPPEICIPDSRARGIPELDSDPDHTNESESCEPRALPPDPFPAVMEAAGFRPRKQELIDQARAQLDAWLADGIDAERTIVPTIRATMANADDDPTSSLARFDRRVRHAHAKRAASPSAAPRSASPAAPLPTPADDPDPRMPQIRSALARECGARSYEGWLRPCRLSLDCDGELLISAPSEFTAQWVSDHFSGPIRSIARSVGINSISIVAPPPTPPSRRNSSRT